MSEAQRQSRATVMVVDDDADIREVLQLWLTRAGYEVLTAGNGREAMDILTGSSHPCVILLDLMMPILDGHEFLKERGADTRLAAIPVIVITAGALPTLSARVAVSILRKPLDCDELALKIQQCCGC